MIEYGPLDANVIERFNAQKSLTYQGVQERFLLNASMSCTLGDDLRPLYLVYLAEGSSSIGKITHFPSGRRDERAGRLLFFIRLVSDDISIPGSIFRMFNMEAFR